MTTYGKVEWYGTDFLKKIGDRLEQNAHTAGPVIVADMKARAPRADGSGHAGGTHAADLITYKVNRGRSYVELRVGASKRGWYLNLLERGTSKLAAQPWARPAVFGNAAAVVRLMLRGR